MSSSPPEIYPRAALYSRAELAFHAAMALPNGAALLLAVTWLAAHAQVAAAAWPWMLVATQVGATVADFVSGLLHWLFDTWFDERLPGLSRLVALVREHHVRPEAIHRQRWYHDLGPLSGIALAVSLPALLPVAADDPPDALDYAAVWGAVVANLCIVLMLELHKLGHRPWMRGPLGWLQRAHLICSPRHHGRHHAGAHDVNYCIVNGLADHLLNRIGFWRGLEAAVIRLTGARPRSNDRLWRRRYRASARLRRSAPLPGPAPSGAP